MNWHNNNSREKTKLSRRDYNRSTHHMITSVRRSRLARKLFINECFSSLVRRRRSVVCSNFPTTERTIRRNENKRKRYFGTGAMQCVHVNILRPDVVFLLLLFLGSFLVVNSVKRRKEKRYEMNKRRRVCSTVFVFATAAAANCEIR